MSSHRDWIGVDLDGTLAHYDKWAGGLIGEPVPAMVERVKGWLAEGKTVKIFTARAADPTNIPMIEVWLMTYLGVLLPITNVKDKRMVELWDDVAVRVIKNTGVVDNNYCD